MENCNDFCRDVAVGVFGSFVFLTESAFMLSS